MSLPSTPFRVLVTGGCGFVGRYLVSALCDSAGEIIVGRSKGETPTPSDRVRNVELDVTDARQVESVITAERPTHLFHLAAVTAVPAAQWDARKTFMVNFEGTLNIALAIRQAVPECRLLYCSSAEVYGSSFNSGRALDESALLDPSSVYGASKAAADLLVGQMAKQGLRAIRLRPFNHTGSGQSEDFVVPALAAQIARIERGEQDSIMHVGDLSMRRDFLDVRDVVDAYLRAIARFDDLPRGCVLNIASGRAFAIREILEILLSQSSKKIEVCQDKERLRPNDTPVVVGDASLAKRLLDWAPQHDIVSTLVSVLDYCRRN